MYAIFNFETQENFEYIQHFDSQLTFERENQWTDLHVLINADEDLQNGMKIQEVTVRNIVFFYCMTLADISCKVPFFENSLPSTIIFALNFLF